MPPPCASPRSKKSTAPQEWSKLVMALDFSSPSDGKPFYQWHSRKRFVISACEFVAMFILKSTVANTPSATMLAVGRLGFVKKRTATMHIYEGISNSAKVKGFGVDIWVPYVWRELLHSQHFRQATACFCTRMSIRIMGSGVDPTA